MTDQEIENLSLLDLYREKSEANKKMKKTKAGQLHKRLDDSWKKEFLKCKLRKRLRLQKWILRNGKPSALSKIRNAISRLD